MSNTSSLLFAMPTYSLNSLPIAEIWELARPLLDAGGCFRLWPRGKSMLPLLREGRDSVLLASPKDVKVGDILLAKTEGGAFLLHRAVKITDKGVLLAGDALLRCEGPLPPDAILGKVVRVFRDERELYIGSLRLRAFWLLARIRRRLWRLWHRMSGMPR